MRISEKGRRKILKKENWIINCEFDHKDPIKISNHSNHAHNLVKQNSNTSINDGSVYRVVSLPTPSPNHGPFELLTEPADPDASPFGCHDIDGVDGAGNGTGSDLPVPKTHSSISSPGIN